MQFLEGFALGSAVVEAGFGALKAALLAISYSLSTPLGIAIGRWHAVQLRHGSH